MERWGGAALCAVLLGACGSSNQWSAVTAPVDVSPDVARQMPTIHREPPETLSPGLPSLEVPRRERPVRAPQLHALEEGGWLMALPSAVQSVAITSKGTILVVPRGLSSLLELESSGAVRRFHRLGDLMHGESALAAENGELVYLTYRRSTNYPSGPGTLRLDLETGTQELLSEGGDECTLSPIRHGPDGTIVEAWACSGRPGIQIYRGDDDAHFTLGRRDPDRAYGLVSGAPRPDGQAVVVLAIDREQELFGRTIGQDHELRTVMIRVANNGDVISMVEVSDLGYSLLQGVAADGFAVIANRTSIVGMGADDQIRWRIDHPGSYDPGAEPFQVLADGTAIVHYSRGCGAVIERISRRGVRERLLAIGEIEAKADASSCGPRIFVSSARVHDGRLFVGGGTWKGVAQVHGVALDPDTGFLLQLPLRDE